MKILIIIVLGLSVINADAAWPWTNTWDVGRGGIFISSNMINAVNERRHVQNQSVIDYDDYTNQYRTMVGQLVEVKDYVGSAIGKYAKKHELDNGGFDACLAATNHNQNLSASFGWASDTILEYLKMPTNYFTFTPARSLDGLGGNTNDAAMLSAVGRAYGFTNAFTAAGGTNFPSGQTYWTTTDYGWPGCQAIINELVWSLSRSFNINTVNGKYGADAWNTTSWADAKAEAESDFNSSSSASTTHAKSYGKLISGWHATLTAKEFQLEMPRNGSNTRFVFNVTFYTYVTNASFSTGNHGEFDDNGTGYTIGWNNVGNEDASYTPYATSAVLGTISMPVWCAEPVIGNAWRAKGYDINYGGPAELSKFDSDSTNGFLYVK